MLLFNDNLSIYLGKKTKMSSFSGEIFERLYFTQAYQTGGALCQNDQVLTITSCNFNENGGQVYSTYGGAISYSGAAEGKTLTITDAAFTNNSAHHGGAINAPQVLNLVDVSFTNNQADPGSFAGYGGAIFIQGCQELNYTVTSGKIISNQGNYASIGGFLHDHEGKAAITFNIENNASLIIGAVNTSTDSINLHKGSKLIKTGEGTMVINSVLERRHPYTSEGTCTDGDITVAGGILELNRGGNFDGTVKITGGQLKLGANYSFNSVEFELYSDSQTAMVADWSKLSTSVVTIDVSNAETGCYILADNAAALCNRTITVTDNVSNYTMRCGESVTINGVVYSLAASARGRVSMTVNGGQEDRSLVVTTAGDVVDANDGVTSLREAIAYAATLSGKRTVSFNISSEDTVVLNSAIAISSDILIDGSNAATNNNITIRTATTYAESRNGLGGASNYSLFNVTGNEFGLQDITIQGGSEIALFITEATERVDLRNVTFMNSYNPIRSLAQYVTVDNIYSVNNWGGLELGKNILITNSTFDGSNLRASNEVNGGLVLIAEGTNCTIVNSTLLNNEVDHSGSALYIGSGTTVNLVNTTIENARGYLGYGNTLCSVLGGQFNLLNSIVVTAEGWRTPDIGAAFGSSNTIRNSVYGTTSYSNSTTNSYSGYNSEDIFVTPGETNENNTLTVRDDASVLNNAVLAAVDPETLTVYYSEDNGTTWKKLSDNSFATIDNSWIITQDQNGNSRLDGNNKIGAVTTTGTGTTPQPPAGDNNNHSFATAIFLGTDTEITDFSNGSLPVAYEEDYYKFSLTKQAEVTLTTRGNSGDTVMYLYDENCNQIACDDDGGDGYFSNLQRTLEAGTYYVKIHAYSSGTVADYALDTNINITDPENHSFDTAVFLGSDEEITDFSNGSLPVAYEEDYYKFSLTKQAEVTLTTRGNSGDTVMYLYDENRNQIACDDDGGDGNFSNLQRTLEAGTYYVKIHAYSDGTVANYTLDTNINIIDPENHSFDTAIFLGSDEEITDFSNGSLPVAYEEDYYKFTLTKQAEVTLTTNGNSGDTVMYLYDENHNQIASDDDSGAGLFSHLQTTLNAGTYYVKINAYSNETVADYALDTNINIINPGSNFDDNHSFDTAYFLGTDSQIQVAENGAISNSGEEDYYYFTLTQQSTLKWTTSGNSGGDTVLHIYDENHNEIGYNDDGGEGYFSSITKTFAAGTYYVKVSAYSTGTVPNYSLTPEFQTPTTQSLVVNTAADEVNANDGVISLREAVDYAATFAEQQVITFDGDYTIDISSTLNCSANVCIEAAQNQNVILTSSEYHDDVAFCSSSGYTVLIKNLQFQNYINNNDAGVISNQGNLTVESCIFSENEAESRGGAIHSGNYGSAILTVKNSQFINNSSGYKGGAIDSDGQSLTIENCTFSGNTGSLGGAISNSDSYSSGNSLVIRDSSFLTASDTIYNTGAMTLEGVISTAADIYSTRTIDASNATVNFLVSAFDNVYSEAIIGNLSLISGADYQVTVRADQANGTYKLADNAGFFNAGMSLTIDNNTYDTVLSLNNSYVVDGKTYTLSQNDNNTLVLTISHDSSFDNNHSFDTAYFLGTDSRIQSAVDAAILHSGEEDYYSFTLTQQSNVTWTTSGNSGGDTVLYLYDGNRNQIGYDDDGSNNRFSTLTQTLDAGTYYVKVSAYGNGTISNYSLTPEIYTSEVQSLVVTTAEDVVDANDGVTSLREAVAYAATLNNNAVITFGDALFADGDCVTISLDSSLSVKEFESNNTTLIISGRMDGKNIVLDVDQQDKILCSGDNDLTLVLKNLTFNNGYNRNGGAIDNGYDTLTIIDNCTFVNNTGIDGGGAIVNWGGNMIVLNSTFANNSDRYGGDIFNFNGFDGRTAHLSVVNSILMRGITDWYGSGGGIIHHDVGNLYGSTASVSDTFADVDNGKALLNADGTLHITETGAAAGNGVYVWHNEDYSAIAYSLTYNSEKISIRGNASEATILSTDQLGNERTANNTDIGAVLANPGTEPPGPMLPATSLEVTTAEDVVDANDGVTSLREALAYAATLSGSQTITFAGDYNITLNATLEVNSDVVIDGGSNNVTITVDSSNLTVFEFNGDTFKVNNVDFYAVNQTAEFVYKTMPVGRVITLTSGSFYISNSSVEGFKPYNAIAALEDTYLQVDNCFFQNNISSTMNDSNGYYCNGGAIWVNGEALINNTTFVSNTAGVAGAVFMSENSNGTTNIVNCSFVNNDSHHPYYGMSIHSQSNLYVQNSIIVDDSRNSVIIDRNMYYPYVVVRNSIFSSTWANVESDNISGRCTADIYSDLEIDTDANGNKYLAASPTKITANAILSAVDSDNVLYYSSDGNVWYKTRDNSAASDEKNAYLSQHIIGNRNVESNVVGVLFNSATPPQPPVVEGDQDDQISEATNLISVITAAIDEEQDVDMYKFTVSADEKIILQTSEVSGKRTLDSYLRLFDANGNELAANDDGGLNLYSLLNYTFRETGTYYVGVSHYANAYYDAVTGENDQTGKIGSYQLTLTRNGFDDSNDQISEAAALEMETETAGKIAFASDVNMYKFDVAENEIREFSLSAVNIENYYIRVFNGDGQELASGSESVEYAFQIGGTYYVGISGSQNTNYNAVNGSGDTNTSLVGDYTLSMQTIIRTYQDNDDTLATATESANTNEIIGEIEAATDVDIYKFNVREHEEFTIDIADFSHSGDFNVTLRFFDSDGNVLAQSDGIADSLTYKFTSDATVYLGVSDNGNIAYNPLDGSNDALADTGSYTLTVRSRINQEVLLSSAMNLGNVTVSGPVVDSASIARLSEVDMYSFSVNAGDKVWIDLDNLSGSRLDSYFRLFDADGNELASNDDGNAAGESVNTCESYLEYTFSVAGTYYLGVSSYGNQNYNIVANALVQSGDSTGNYRLAFGLIQEIDSDPDDTMATAVSISAGENKQAAIESRTDVDMYKITLAAGETLNVSVSLQGLQDSYLRLFDANGNSLADNDDIGNNSMGSKNGKGSQISWVANEEGTYYIGVSGYGNIVYNPVTGDGDIISRYTGNYTISANVTPSASRIRDDEYENNDTMATAADFGTINAKTNITGLTMNDSADWFKFTLAAATGAGSEVKLNASKAKDLCISVYNASGDLVGYEASGKNGVSLANLSAGEYFIKVSGAESNNYHVAFDIKTAPTVTVNRSENYVVLFSGGYNVANNRTYYYDSIKHMYEIATETYGVDPSHVYILFADGTYVGIDNANGGNSDMSYACNSTVLSATENNLRDVFLTIADTMDSNDHFLFYSFDHGSESWDGTDYLCGWNEMIQDKNFAEYASWLTCGYQTYLFSQCYSGGMLEDMSVSNNIFIGSASDNDSPSHTAVSLITGQALSGFSVEIENGLAQGINNTQELFAYMMQNSTVADRDNPQQAGGNFQIFAGETNSNSVVSNSNNIIMDNGIVNTGFEINKNGTYLPVVTALAVSDEGMYYNLNSAQIGNTISVSAKALSLNENIDIAKVEFYYTNSNGVKQLLAIDNNQEDGWQILWNIDQSFAAGHGVISAVAQDSDGTYGTSTEVDFQILEHNYHPDITSITVNANKYYPGATVTVSGSVTDYDNNGIDSVRIFLDSDKNGVFSYPDEFLSITSVAANGSWSYSFALDSNMQAGDYALMAEAVDTLDMMTGQSMSVTFNITDGVISNFESSENLIQWKNSTSDNCTIEISDNNFTNVVSVNTNGSSIDIINLQNGSYQSRGKYTDEEQWSDPQKLTADNQASESTVLSSNNNGVLDVFFARAADTWGEEYAAQHQGELDGWAGTREAVLLSGKNQLTDIFAGSTDTNILLMTDDVNGDSLFVDDIYTALPEAVAEQQARIAQINEIRAGIGDDVVDMTSQRFAYVGDGVKVYGGLGDDTIWANNGCNILFGDSGKDRLVGGSGDDIIIGGEGNDSMHGGGGDDVFTFGGAWGSDTVEQLADGSVTLWFENGSERNWNASTLTYTDGVNSVRVSGVSNDNITLKFGADDALPEGCFAEAASEKIFEDKNKGMLA